MKVLINADDFGLSRGVTDGIIEAHKNGVVDSTTLMMNGLDIDYAVQCAKENPLLKTGIHLVLTWGYPVLQKGIPSLINSEKTFRLNNNYENLAIPNTEEVYKEWKAQIEAFLATGLSLHHIDSHHHIHGWEPLAEVSLALAKEYNVPLRYQDSLAGNDDFLLTDSLYTGFYGDYLNKDFFNEIKSEDIESVEIMTHPAYIDNTLKNNSSYLEQREKELEILTSVSRPKWSEKL